MSNGFGGNMSNGYSVRIDRVRAPAGTRPFKRAAHVKIEEGEIEPSVVCAQLAPVFEAMWGLPVRVVSDDSVDRWVEMAHEAIDRVESGWQGVLAIECIDDALALLRSAAPKASQPWDAIAAAARLTQLRAELYRLR